MSLLYNNLGEVQMYCDLCEKKTAFYSTLADLYAAINFNAPITTDAGSSSWVWGCTKVEITGGYQPNAVRTCAKHACSQCKGAINGLVYATEPPRLGTNAQRGQIGQPDQQVKREDMALNKDIMALFDGTTPALPKSYPANEPGFTLDSTFVPMYTNTDLVTDQEV